MNKVKYILITLILLAGFLLPGEFYQLYVNQFNDFYETSFYLQGSATKEQMLEDISFNAGGDMPDVAVVINGDYVREHLGEDGKTVDMKRYIL